MQPKLRARTLNGPVRNPLHQPGRPHHAAARGARSRAACRSTCSLQPIRSATASCSPGFSPRRSWFPTSPPSPSTRRAPTASLID